MTEQMIDQRVRALIADQLSVDVSTIAREATLDSLGLDSIDQVELLMNLEDEFSIEIPDEVAARYKTVDDIVTQLAKHFLINN